jgi:hypothetical protein
LFYPQVQIHLFINKSSTHQRPFSKEDGRFFYFTKRSEENNMSVSAEEKKRYFQETATALRREGFRVEPSVGGRLAVWLDDHPLCEVDQIGGITYRSDNIPTPEYVAAKDKAYRIVCTTAEYMRQMEQAPPLKASGLADGYKILADFNGTVLAGTHGKYGVEFVTWDWDHDRKGVSHGHYFTGNYEGAKQDFATRSGLIPEQKLFRDEQLIEIYRCCADTLEAGFDLTYEQEKRIKSVQEQIENGMPDIMDRIREQDQHTMELPTQEQTM